MKTRGRLAWAALTLSAALRADGSTPSGGPATQNAPGPPAAESPLKQLSLAQLMDVEVTSVSRRPEKLAQSPSAIQVITGDEIRRSGASSIPEVLRLADNLAVAQKNAHDWAISARGFNTDLANKLLVLIDGRSVYTPLFSGVFWSQQDYLLEDVERIEVISGPGGTLWGANAVNGVINIITKSAADTEGGFVELGGGEPLQRFIAGRYGGSPTSGVHVRGYGKYSVRGPEVLPDGMEASDSWRTGQGGFRLDAGSVASSLLTIQADAHLSREHLGTGGEARLGGGNLLGRWSHQWSDESNTTFQLYYDRTHLVQPTPALMAGGNVLAPPGVLKDDLDTYDLDFQHRLRAGRRNRVVWGLGFRLTHDVVVSAPGLAFVPPILDRRLFSGFAQDEVELSPRIALTLGTKVEHNSYTGFEVEPTARLKWSASSKTMAWAAVSRAVRMPSRVDRHERLPTPAFSPLIDNLLIGGEDFSSETMISYEAGLRSQWGDTFSASLAAFYSSYDRLRSTSTSPPPAPLGLPLFFANNLEGTTMGAELSLDYQPRNWWRLHAGLALLGEDVHVKAGKTDFNNALNETADPSRRFSARSSMNLGQALEWDVQFRFVGSFRFNNAGVAAMVPGYGEADTQLLWHATKRLDLAMVGRNLMHDQHLEYVISSPNPREKIRRGVFGRLVVRW